MRHHKANRKFGRERDQREALFRSLLNNFILHGKLEITAAKAKELRPKVEKLVTRARKDTLSTRRLLGKRLTQRSVEKMLKVIGPKYAERPGGYVRIIKLPPRKGDAASRAIIEFV
jgi:large subunit ribosomal protein L17